MSDGRQGGCGQRGDIRQSSTATMVFCQKQQEKITKKQAKHTKTTIIKSKVIHGRVVKNFKRKIVV